MYKNKTWISIACETEERDNFKKFCEEEGYSQTRLLKVSLNKTTGKKMFKV